MMCISTTCRYSAINKMESNLVLAVTDGIPQEGEFSRYCLTSRLVYASERQRVEHAR